MIISQGIIFGIYIIISALLGIAFGIMIEKMHNKKLLDSDERGLK